jgi:hypothetical protein
MYHQSRLLVLGLLCCAAVACAQQTAVPRLVRFAGSFHPPAGQPGGPIGARLAIYGQAEGGTPLWTEDQSVELDANGNYTVLLGAATNAGVPLELFTAGESRWLQVSFSTPGAADPPRVLLVSVPYALKAADAETLGGNPASAYLLAGSVQAANAAPAVMAAAVPEATSVPGYIPRFINTSGVLGSSAMYQSGSSIGVGTKTPGATLEVNGNAQVDGGGILSTGSKPVIQFPATGSNNFSAGLAALPSATTGTENTVIGDNALAANTSGSNNTAGGYQALYSNTTGDNNTAIGFAALDLNTTGGYNIAIGNDALNQNTGGNDNTAVGGLALFHNSTGSNNIAVGYTAGSNVTTTGNNIEIGHNGVAGDSGVIRIGTAGTQTSAFIAGIYGVTTSVSSAVPVLVDSNGNLGTISSSRRYKEDIQDMADASSGLLRLRPVTFRYKMPYSDGSQPLQYGLIAEEVAELYPDLVARTAGGQIETVKYQVLDSMLLNEMQKQNATITAQREQIRSLEERLAKVEAVLEGAATPGSSR